MQLTPTVLDSLNLAQLLMGNLQKAPNQGLPLANLGVASSHNPGAGSFRQSLDAASLGSQTQLPQTTATPLEQPSLETQGTLAAPPTAATNPTETQGAANPNPTEATEAEGVSSPLPKEESTDDTAAALALAAAVMSLAPVPEVTEIESALEFAEVVAVDVLAVPLAASLVVFPEETISLDEAGKTAPVQEFTIMDSSETAEETPLAAVSQEAPKEESSVKVNPEVVVSEPLQPFSSSYTALTSQVLQLPQELSTLPLTELPPALVEELTPVRGEHTLSLEQGVPLVDEQQPLTHQEQLSESNLQGTAVSTAAEHQPQIGEKTELKPSTNQASAENQWNFNQLMVQQSEVQYAPQPLAAVTGSSGLVSQVSHWMHSLEASGLRVSEGQVTTMELTLHPRNLGKLVLKLELEQGELRAYFHTQSQIVKEALDSQMGDLRNMLMQQGLDIGHLNVQVGQGQQQETNAGNSRIESSTQLQELNASELHLSLEAASSHVQNLHNYSHQGGRVYIRL